MSRNLAHLPNNEVARPEIIMFQEYIYFHTFPTGKDYAFETHVVVDKHRKSAPMSAASSSIILWMWRESQATSFDKNNELCVQFCWDEPSPTGRHDTVLWILHIIAFGTSSQLPLHIGAHLFAICNAYVIQTIQYMIKLLLYIGLTKF
jgi:hypothetical protein